MADDRRWVHRLTCGRSSYLEQIEIETALRVEAEARRILAVGQLNMGERGHTSAANAQQVGGVMAGGGRGRCIQACNQASRQARSR